MSIKLITSHIHGPSLSLIMHLHFLLPAYLIHKYEKPIALLNFGDPCSEVHNWLYWQVTSFFWRVGKLHLNSTVLSNLAFFKSMEKTNSLQVHIVLFPAKESIWTTKAIYMKMNFLLYASSISAKPICCWNGSHTFCAPRFHTHVVFWQGLFSLTYFVVPTVILCKHTTNL